MDYKVDDKNLDVSMFISFVNQVWQGNYDMEQTRQALSKTLNITAYDSELPPAIEQAASNKCSRIHQNVLFVFRYT